MYTVYDVILLTYHICNSCEERSKNTVYLGRGQYLEYFCRR